MPREPTQETHLKYLSQALSLARLSPPKPTNFRVGCVIVSYAEGTQGKGIPLSTGYTLELSGNTHAEQCALTKLAQQHQIPEEHLNHVLTPEVNTILYTTLEPCGKRLSGNLPCVERIIATREGNTSGGVRKVVFGAKEPGTFVQDSKSLQRLDQAGVSWEFVQSLDDEILQVAMEGHAKKDDAGKASDPSKSELQEPAMQAKKLQLQQEGTNVDDISPAERKRQEDLPRNPKKRMMEVEVPP